MGEPKKATVYLEPELHKALRMKAAETDISLSDVVNDAIKSYLSEDADDLSDYRKRKNEPTISFEKLVAKLKADGRI